MAFSSRPVRVHVSWELPFSLLHRIATDELDAVAGALGPFSTVIGRFSRLNRPVGCGHCWTQLSSAWCIDTVFVCRFRSGASVAMYSLLTCCPGCCPPSPQVPSPARCNLQTVRPSGGSVSACQHGSSWVPSQQAPSATHLCCRALLVCAGLHAELRNRACRHQSAGNLRRITQLLTT